MDSKIIWKVSSSNIKKFNDITVIGNVNIYILIWKINQKDHVGLVIIANKIYRNSKPEKIGNMLEMELDGDINSISFINMKLKITNISILEECKYNDIYPSIYECTINNINNLYIPRLYTLKCLKKMYSLTDENKINCVSYVNYLLEKFLIFDRVSLKVFNENKHSIDINT